MEAGSLHTPRTWGALATERALVMPFPAQTTTETVPALLD